MEQNFRPLFYYGTKFSDDEEMVKDTIQELFIRLWDKKENLSTDVNPKAYLIASLRRALHRKIQSQSRFSNYSELEDNLNYFDMEASAEEKLIEKEVSANKSQKIAANINSLPKRQKEVIYLKFFQEMSRDEISETMSIMPQTVSNLLQLALKKLRTDMNAGLLVFVSLFRGKD